MSINNLYIYCISFFCCNLFAISGFVNIGQTQTEKDWDFMPTISNSFKSSETSYNDVLIYSQNPFLKYYQILAKNPNFVEKYFF